MKVGARKRYLMRETCLAEALLKDLDSIGWWRRRRAFPDWMEFKPKIYKSVVELELLHISYWTAFALLLYQKFHLGPYKKLRVLEKLAKLLSKCESFT